MYKGSTPTYRFIMPEDVDLTEADNVYVTFSREDGVELITKSTADLVIKSAYVEASLTQEESLSFPTDDIKVQLNWTYKSGNITKRGCSNILTIKSCNNLKNEVLS